MIRDNIGAYLIQEMWDLNYDVRDISGHLVLHHNYDAKKDCLFKLMKGQGMNGLAIILLSKSSGGPTALSRGLPTWCRGVTAPG